MNKDKKTYSWLAPTIIFFLAILLITALWLGSFIGIRHYWPDKIGTIGDSFGAINALFSGLAFAGLIATIFIQMKELELTREELRKSSEAQQKSEQALSEQVEQMNKTAKLNALSSIVNYLTSEASNATHPVSRNLSMQSAQRYIQEIKGIAEIE